MLKNNKNECWIVPPNGFHHWRPGTSAAMEKAGELLGLTRGSWRLGGDEARPGMQAGAKTTHQTLSSTLLTVAGCPSTRPTTREVGSMQAATGELASEEEERR